MPSPLPMFSKTPFLVAALLLALFARFGHLDPNHWHMLNAQHLYRQGLLAQSRHDYAAAERLWRAALEGYEGHALQRAGVAECLAELLQEKGRLAESDELFESCLRTYQAKYGSDHFDTTFVRNKLASNYAAEYRFAEAEKLYKQSVESATRTKRQWQAAALYNNLALVYEGMERLPEAELFARKALDLDRTIFGGDALKLPTGMRNLSGILRKEGSYVEAEVFANKALTRFRTIDPQSSESVGALDSLATIYAEQGKYESAQPLAEDALAISERISGHVNFTTAALMNNLAYIYYCQDNYQKAKPLFEESLKIQQSLCGKNSPATSSTINNLGLLYMAQKEYDKSESFLKRALALDATGPGVLEPASTMHNLGELYRDQGRVHEARRLFKSVLDVRRALLGENHPETLRVAKDLSLLPAQ